MVQSSPQFVESKIIKFKSFLSFAKENIFKIETLSAKKKLLLNVLIYKLAKSIPYIRTAPLKSHLAQ